MNKIAFNSNYRRAFLFAFASFFLLFLVDHLQPEMVEYPTMEQLVESNNYRLITHTIMTEDGYFLSLYRIVPKQLDVNTIVDRKPVLIVPGMFVSTNIFFFQPPNITPELNGNCSNIVFCLLKTARYDVWIINLRGTSLASDKHINMTKNDPKFWDYSFEEMAIYDLPASIDYIKKNTGSKHRIAMLGYSMGGTIQGIFITMRPEYSSQIHPYVAWSPAVIFDGSKSVFEMPKAFPNFPWASMIRFLLNLVHHKLKNYILAYVPNELLSNYIASTAGTNGKINTSHLPYFWNLANPSGEKSLVLEHYLSIINNRKFVQFNANRHLRTLHDPPESFREYPWENMPKNLTMIVMYGASDAFVTPMDARRLVRILQEHGVDAMLYKIKSTYWNHCNFITGSDVARLVNTPTIEFLDRNY